MAGYWIPLSNIFKSSEGSSRKMKSVTIILFLLGCFWALICWAFVISPIGIFDPSYRFQTHDVFSSLLVSVLSIVGYYVWFGWGFYWKKNRFPWVTVSQFWTISLLVHVLWFLVFPFLLEISYAELLDIGMGYYLGWIVINILVATVFLLTGMIAKGEAVKLEL